MRDQQAKSNGESTLISIKMYAMCYFAFVFVI